jgi:hypothetical protein
MLSRESAQYLLNVLGSLSVKIGDTVENEAAAAGQALRELKSVLTGSGADQGQTHPSEPVAQNQGAVEPETPVHPAETPNPSGEGTPSEG